MPSIGIFHSVISLGIILGLGFRINRIINKNEVTMLVNRTDLSHPEKYLYVLADGSKEEVSEKLYRDIESTLSQLTAAFMETSEKLKEKSKELELVKFENAALSARVKSLSNGVDPDDHEAALKDVATGMGSFLTREK